MHVTDFPSMNPSVCFVCEGAEPGAKFVDTSRSTNFAPMTHLDGRKYVCSICTRDIANALDLFGEAKAPLEEALAAANETIDTLTADIAAFTDIKAVVERLAAKKAKTAGDTPAAS